MISFHPLSPSTFQVQPDLSSSGMLLYCTDEEYPPNTRIIICK